MMSAVKHIGGRWRPGDVLPDDLPRATIEWLTAAGAIRMESAHEAPPTVSPPEEPEDEFDDEAVAEEIDAMDGIIADKPKTGRRKGGSRK